ncbi:lactose permease [Thozetella sp. PMI_491]|nr:lactose permease [Thozetella sp. PMI_491]
MVIGDGTSDPIVTRLAEQDKTPWYKKPNMRIMYLWLFLCCMGVEMTSGFDSSLINNLQNIDNFKLYFGGGYKNPKGKLDIEASLLGIINASYQLGSIFAVPFAPWVNNRYGRRMGIVVGSVVMCVGSIIQGFAVNPGMYIAARIILGWGILFAIISGSSLIGELGHPKERASLTSLFNASYGIGAILGTAVTMASSDIPSDYAWRIPSWLQICPSILQLATVYLLPESPRWLVSRDREDEAYAVLTKYHAEGDQTSILVQAEIAQIVSTLKIEAEHSKQSWMTMVRTSAMRRRIFIAAFLGLFTQMSGNTLLSYYSNKIYDIMGFTDQYRKFRLNMGNSCWGFLIGVVVALIVPRYPRRRMFMLSSSSMTICFTVITICYYFLEQAANMKLQNWPASIAALVFWWLYTPCYNIGNNALTYTYLVELFPYAVRSRGIGVEQIFGKSGGFFSTFVNPIAMDNIGWKFFAAYCGWIVLEFVFQFFFYPETYGRTLEELTFLFEDKALAEQAVQAVHKQIDSAPQAPLDILELNSRSKGG